MHGRLRHMLIKEFIHLFRDPRLRTIVIVMPMVQLFIFGYAANLDVTEVRTALCDFDHSPVSRDLVSRFADSQYFQIVSVLSRYQEVIPALNSGHVDAALIIPPGFGAKVQGGGAAKLQVIVDGSVSTIAMGINGYVNAIVLGYNEKIMLERLDLQESARYLQTGLALPMPGRIVLNERAWFNTNLLSRNFYVPGVIAMIMMLMALIMTSMAVVKEREMGTMEQLLVTPIRPWELILGKTLPFALVAFLDVSLVIIVAVFWFKVPFLGGVFFFIVCAVFYLLAALGVGLYMSTLVRSQQQAMLTTFLFFNPAILLSGFIFPINNMPTVIQWLTYLNPLRYFIEIVRGVFLKGVGFAILWPQLLALIALAFALFAASSIRFRKQLE